jgi:hypothetical protein
MYDLRGTCKRLTDDLPGSIADHSMAISLNPTEGIYYLNRSIAYATAGEKGKAMEDARKAHEFGVGIDSNYIDGLTN